MKDAAGPEMESRVPQHIPGVPPAILGQPLLDSRVPYGRLPHPLAVFPIDQMKSSHAENDYIDSPAVVSRQPPAQKVARGGAPHEALLGGSPHPNGNRCVPHQDVTTHPWISFGGRPGSVSSGSSTSSDQRLLDHAAPTPVVDPGQVGTPPPGAPSPPPVPEPLSSSKTPPPLKASAGPAAATKHAPLPCERCGKCRCTECTLPRTLPSCWLCNQACLCSAQNLVDSATCMCLVRGVFYHCTSEEDEEGSCADRPCSCSQANRCARWSFMAALALVLPCLVCYPPAAAVAKLSQRCYDRASRPGCRCRNSPHPGEGKGGGVAAATGPGKQQPS